MVLGEAVRTTVAHSIQTHVHVCVCACARQCVYIGIHMPAYVLVCAFVPRGGKHTQKGQTPAQMEGKVFLKLVLHF